MNTSILAIYCVSSLTLFEDRSTDGLVSQMDKRLLMVIYTISGERLVHSMLCVLPVRVSACPG